MSADRRTDYEKRVRALRDEARRRRAKGENDEQIGRALVAARNALKAEFRRMDDPADVQWMEERNLDKYGDPIGPGAEWFLARYGSWTLVVEAACRPADLSRST